MTHITDPNRVNVQSMRPYEKVLDVLDWLPPAFQVVVIVAAMPIMLVCLLVVPARYWPKRRVR